MPEFDFDDFAKNVKEELLNLRSTLERLEKDLQKRKEVEKKTKSIFDEWFGEKDEEED